MALPAIGAGCFRWHNQAGASGTTRLKPPSAGGSHLRPPSARTSGRRIRRSGRGLSRWISAPRKAGAGGLLRRPAGRQGRSLGRAGQCDRCPRPSGGGQAQAAGQSEPADHRRDVRQRPRSDAVSVTAERVCVPHGLRFYDHQAECIRAFRNGARRMIWRHHRQSARVWARSGS